jgi:Uma2 family endonuclease
MNQHVSIKTFEGSRPHLVSADEFWRMIDIGAFANARVELVKGKLVEMAPSSMPHGMLVARIGARIYNAYEDKDWVHVIDTYVTLAPSTVRAPDIAVVARTDDDGTELTGNDVMLAIEVSHSTLKEDLKVKRRHYAQSGIRHYWVVDVEGERVHCFAEPKGGDYTAVVVSAFSEPLPLPGCNATILIG